ncbi:uncharacterized protein ARMOST_12911 [Armillaria ostoyae]|uniref:Uncharacterized protein n=1 Tax=Armillaria ostoyae TaxID=47428 RepID=A0A284RL89_ARMOS|nr:uncharacterized protein ARMOST_12911 [Armillaria ostoyae]
MFPRSDTPEPDADVLPRTRLQGGFVMDSDTAIEWASRIAHEQFTKDRINKVWQIIERKVKPYGSRFSFVGEERHAEFMVVTRRATFPKGYKGMDPSLILRFKEGEQEKVARKLLDEEGLSHLEFATRLD